MKSTRRILSALVLASAANAQDVDTSEWACEYCAWPDRIASEYVFGVGWVSDDAYRFGHYSGLEDGEYAVAAGHAVRSTESDYWRVSVDQLDLEARRGVGDAATYREFAGEVERLRGELTAELARRKRGGQRLAAYGASAKGSTLMNAFGIGAETLEFVADRSTVKQGRYTPGNHLPILPPEALAERRPDAVLLLTWNFADEIIAQQAAYLEAGGAFIIPVPTVRTVGKEALS